jgi:hypothetical protein
MPTPDRGHRESRRHRKSYFLDFCSPDERHRRGINITFGDTANHTLRSIQGKMADKKRMRSGPSPARSRTRGQRVPWLAELENISLGHGVSLPRWRSGSFDRDTPPQPFKLSRISPEGCAFVQFFTWARLTDHRPVCREAGLQGFFLRPQAEPLFQGLFRPGDR